MTKFFLYLFGFLFFVEGFSQSRNYGIEAVYQKVLLKERIDQEAIQDSRVKSQIISIEKSFESLNYKLLSNGHESLFFLQPSLSNDGLPVNSRAVGKGGGNGKYYVNIEEDLLIHQTDLFGRQFRVRYPVPRYNWTLHKNSKSIAGYTCYRATAEVIIDDFRGILTQHIEAWYSPELPSSLGPADFVGLPGMVLEGGSGNIRFRIKSINKKKNPKIIRPLKGELVNNEEFIAI